jgi:hypothetical protein
MVVKKKIKLRLGLSLFKKGNPEWKTQKNLLSDPIPWPDRRKGVPLLYKVWDTKNTTALGFRKYKPPPKPLPRLRMDYTQDDWHQMKARFRFELTGQFDGRMGAFMFL